MKELASDTMADAPESMSSEPTTTDKKEEPTQKVSESKPVEVVVDDKKAESKPEE